MAQLWDFDTALVHLFGCYLSGAVDRKLYIYHDRITKRLRGFGIRITECDQCCVNRTSIGRYLGCAGTRRLPVIQSFNFTDLAAALFCWRCILGLGRLPLETLECTMYTCMLRNQVPLKHGVTVQEAVSVNSIKEVGGCEWHQSCMAVADQKNACATA